MKKILIILLFLSCRIYSQAPQKINYQGIARDAMGVPVTSLSSIGLQFIITDGSSTVIHNELQPNVLINNSGLFNTKIGLITPISNTISWQNGPYNLAVSINLGNGLIALGSQELVSVPYALYAEKSGSSVSQSLTINGNSLSITGGNTIALPSSTAGSTPNTSITGSGIASITTIGTNSFNVFVPATNITGVGNTSVTGAFPNYTISSNSGNTPTIIGTGASTVISVGNNYTVNTPQTNIAGIGNTTISGVFPNYTINTGSGTTPTIIGMGTSTVNTIGNTFTITTPPVNLAYTPSLGILSYTPSQFSNTINISPMVTFNNNTLTVGSSSVLINGTGLWSKPNATTTSLSNANDFVGIGTSNPLFNLEVVNTGNSFIQARSSSSGIVGVILDRPNISSNSYFVHRTASVDDWATGEIGGNSNYQIFNWPNSRSDISISFATGNVGVGTPTAAENLQIERNGATPTRLSIISTNTSAIWFGTSAQHAKGLILYDNNTNEMNFGTNNFTSRLRLFGNGQAAFMGGNVGIGTITPANLLHVNGGVTITDGTQALGRVLTSDASGNGVWAPVSTVTTAAFAGQNISSLGITPVMMASPLTSFTKLSPETKIEVTIQSHIHAYDLVSTNSVRFEIRLNGITASNTTGLIDYFLDNNGAFNMQAYEAAYFTGFFPNLPTGVYNVQIWAYAVNAGGTATNVSINNGNFIGNVIIKEYR